MKLSIFSDESFMKEALKEAQKAYEKNEVPIGAVIVSNNKIIARAHNLCETLNDATAHAEMQAITSAANFLGSKYLNECILFITLEPCAMCASASAWSQIGKIVYGADDDKKGFTKISQNLLHPKTEVVSGVLEKDCSEKLINFFREKRD